MIARLDGKTDKTVVVIAHYDSAANCPGALDNASGIPILLEMAERLSGVELKKCVPIIPIYWKGDIDNGNSKNYWNLTKH